jgi:hypothetical protein
MNKYRSLFCLAACLAAACIPASAAVEAVTPEPRLGALVVLGIGAIAVAVRKVKGR